jgi:hypothetical protein
MSAVSRNIRSIVNHDGGVILDFERDAILTLNSTGAYVWEKLQQGKLIDQIIGDLAQETSIDISTVDHDVREFLTQLKVRHLLCN